jgi:hypothetical protein
MIEETVESLSPLMDPTNVDLRIVEDEPDAGPGMTPDEIAEFLAQPVPPAE